MQSLLHTPTKRTLNDHLTLPHVFLLEIVLENTTKTFNDQLIAITHIRSAPAGEVITAQWSHFKRHYLPLFKFLHSHRCSSFCSSLCALLLFSLYFILLLRSFHLSVWCPPTGCFISMCGCVYAHTQTPFSFHS